MAFVPKQVLIEESALDYPLGRHLRDTFRTLQIPETIIDSHSRIRTGRADTPHDAYFSARRTLVVAVRRSREFQTCKPSAHYQLPLSTSCPGLCSYCYLMTTLGRRPYVKVYVNIDEILALAVRYIEKRLPEETVFEGAATSDPVPVEPYTGSLKTTIEFFAQHKSGRFRFVTKFTDISSLLDARHARQSQVRFSINSEDVIAKHEAGVPRLSPRLAAAKSVAQAGYPVGFMVAPVILAPGWEWGYEALFSSVAKAVEEEPSLGTCTLEFVTHRFTRTGKARINEVFPDSGLPLDECGRTFKFGQFGYGKYVYPKETMQSLEAFFQRLKEKYLPRAQWLYLV